VPGENGVSDRVQPDRRKEDREVRVDRRKSAVDLFERIGDGVHAEHVPAKRRNTPRRPTRRK
jgi:hypothetical protein